VIRVSAGTADVLRLKQSKVDVAPTTGYLMCGEKCSRSCAFCAQGLTSTSRADALSRVTWPEFDVETTVTRLAAAYEEGSLKRACIQVVLDKDHVDHTTDLIKAIRCRSSIPLCVSVNGSMEAVHTALAAGADRVSLPLDAASERVFTEVKGPGWARAVALLESAVECYPGRVGTHIIAGLGETDEELLRLVQKLNDKDALVALFSFTPVRGTKMADNLPPPIERYRAIQAARHMIVHGAASAERMEFCEGRLASFGLAAACVRELLSTGEAFETSGCPDCNRPYYNERPGGVMYNYPRRLTTSEAEEALLQALLYISSSHRG